MTQLFPSLSAGKHKQEKLLVFCYWSHVKQFKKEQPLEYRVKIKKFELAYRYIFEI